MEKGKLIVLDGADSVGKATQTAMLTAKLNELGYLTETTDFPRYESNFFGRLIGQCQNDEKLKFAEVDPYLASILYAGDRFESKAMLSKWLHEGKNIVSDRYVSANQLHQGGKIKDLSDRLTFLQYLDEMEYNMFGIPRPDLILLLDLPHDISLELMKKKESGKKKLYSQGEIDQVEQHLEYQLGARESGIKMLADKTWVRINCATADGKGILHPEVIHDEILSHVRSLLQ